MCLWISLSSSHSPTFSFPTKTADTINLLPHTWTDPHYHFFWMWGERGKESASKHSKKSLFSFSPIFPAGEWVADSKEHTHLRFFFCFVCGHESVQTLERTFKPPLSLLSMSHVARLWMSHVTKFWIICGALWNAVAGEFCTFIELYAAVYA